MKYVLKGLEVSVKGNMINKGDLDFSLKLEEVQLEGNFEEVYKELVPVITSIINDSINKEEENNNVEPNDTQAKKKEEVIKTIDSMFDKVRVTAMPQEQLIYGEKVVATPSFDDVIFIFSDYEKIVVGHCNTFYTLNKVVDKLAQLIDLV